MLERPNNCGIAPRTFLPCWGALALREAWPGRAVIMALAGVVAAFKVVTKRDANRR